MRLLKEERGISLMEVVASIVLITIILISFFGFFIQSSKHTKFNEEKLKSIEIAENVIAEIRKSPDNYKSNTPIAEVIVFDTGYTVLLTIEDGPNSLKEATIEVTPIAGKGIKQSPFITHIYYEVTP